MILPGRNKILPSFLFGETISFSLAWLGLIQKVCGLTTTGGSPGTTVFCETVCVCVGVKGSLGVGGSVGVGRSGGVGGNGMAGIGHAFTREGMTGFV